MKGLGIIILAGKHLYIITLADKDLGIRKLITCLIIVFNEQKHISNITPHQRRKYLHISSLH